MGRKTDRQMLPNALLCYDKINLTTIGVLSWFVCSASTRRFTAYGTKKYAFL